MVRWTTGGPDEVYPKTPTLSLAVERSWGFRIIFKNRPGHPNGTLRENVMNRFFKSAAFPILLVVVLAFFFTKLASTQHE